MNIHNLTQVHKWLATLRLYKTQRKYSPIYLSVVPITFLKTESHLHTPELSHIATVYGTSLQDYVIGWWQFSSAPEWILSTDPNHNNSPIHTGVLKGTPNIRRIPDNNLNQLKLPFQYINSTISQRFPLSQQRAKQAIKATWITALKEIISETILTDSNRTFDIFANYFDLNLENHSATLTDITSIQHLFSNTPKNFDSIEFVPTYKKNSHIPVSHLNHETLKKFAIAGAIKLFRHFLETKNHANTFSIPSQLNISHDFNLALKQLLPNAGNSYLEIDSDSHSFLKTLNTVMRPLSRLSRNGLPVGDKGLDKIKTLNEFYQHHHHELKIKVELAAKQFNSPTSFNPSDYACLKRLLFDNKSHGGMELEPLKQSGKYGKLWSELSTDEKVISNPSIDNLSLEYLLTQVEREGTQFQLIRSISNYRKVRYFIDNFFPKRSHNKDLFSHINKDGMVKISCDPFTSTFRLRYQPAFLGSIIKNETNSIQSICGEKPPYEVRNCITALPDHVLLFRDWISAEAHLLMLRANDENGLRVIDQKLDFHTLIGLGKDPELTAAFRHWQSKDDRLIIKLRQKSKETFHLKGYSSSKAYFDYLRHLFQGSKESDGHLLLKALFPETRDQLKTVSYGVPNGISPQSIALTTGLPLEKAQQHISSYHETYKQASTYLNLNADFAKAYRNLPSPWGWVKQLPQSLDPSSIGRKAYSFQPQHGIAWMLIQAINDWHHLKNKYNLKSELMLPLHDGLGWHVREKELTDVIEITDIVMTRKRPVSPTDTRTIPTQLNVSESWGSRKLIV